MPHEYSPDQLLQVLRQHGAQLNKQYFQTGPNLEVLICESVKGNTFRSFHNLSRPPSVVFREWASSCLSPSVIEELCKLSNQADFDRFLSDHADHLEKHWLAEGKKPLRFGPGRKLLDLLFKRVLRYEKIPPAARDRLIRFLHVPLDSFSLAAVRQWDETGIPPNSKMGFITSLNYNALQQLMQRIAAAAGVPPICIDLVAWNQAHGL